MQLRRTGNVFIPERYRQWAAGIIFFLVGIGFFPFSLIKGSPSTSGEIHNNLMNLGVSLSLMAIGLIVVLMKIGKYSSFSINRFFGWFGVCMVTVPSLLALPFFVYLYYTRPNFKYNSTVFSFPEKDLWLGIELFIGGTLLHYGAIRLRRFLDQKS